MIFNYSVQKKSNDDSHSKPDAMQQILKFPSIKLNSKPNGHILGGTHVSKNSNPRGIPLNSRLLKSLNRNATSSKSKDSNILHKIRPVGMSSKIQKHFSINRKKFENIKRVTQEMRRIGLQSVNENAPAYTTCKVKTKFSSSKGNKGALLFDSDDELGSDTDTSSVPSKAIRERKSVVTSNVCVSDISKSSFPATIDKHISPHLSASNLCEITVGNSVEKDICIGAKRTFSSRKEKSQPAGFRSPLKKKLNTDFESAMSKDNFKSLSDLPSTSKSMSLTDENYNATSSNEDIFSTKPKIKNSLHPSENVDSSPAMDSADSFSLPAKVACPVCTMLVSSHDINMHIDMCLSLKVIQESNF